MVECSFPVANVRSELTRLNPVVMSRPADLPDGCNNPQAGGKEPTGRGMKREMDGGSS